MKRCIIIGDPIAHSLSPLVHNAGYKALGIDDSYHYELQRIKPEELNDFMEALRTSDIRGVSCTAPHKIAIMRYLDDIDPTARKIGAVNTVVNDNGVLKGYNTDWLGAVLPLEKLVSLQGKRIALLGAGGAARSIVYGVAGRGADLSIYNRTLDKAQELAQEFGGTAEPLNNLEEIKKADIIINATSVGMAPHDDATPLPKRFMTSHHIVFDSIYAPYETCLLRDAAAQGAQIIHGSEMLLQQALAQFKLYTGYDAPENAMREALTQALEPKESPA